MICATERMKLVILLLDVIAIDISNSLKIVLLKVQNFHKGSLRFFGDLSKWVTGFAAHVRATVLAFFLLMKPNSIHAWSHSPFSKKPEIWRNHRLILPFT